MYLLAQATTAVSGPVRRFSLPLLCITLTLMCTACTSVVLGACWIYLLAQANTALSGPVRRFRPTPQ